jgi:hypothetical protein
LQSEPCSAARPHAEFCGLPAELGGGGLAGHLGFTGDEGDAEVVHDEFLPERGCLLSLRRAELDFAGRCSAELAEPRYCL